MIEITPSATEHLKTQGCTGPDVFYIGLEKSGCSGFEWVMKKISQVEAKTLAKGQHGFLMRTPQGIACFVTKSLMHQHGLKVDCDVNALGKKLVVSTTGMSNTCGCGKSFSLPEAQD